VNTLPVIGNGFWDQEHLHMRMGSQEEVREDESFERKLQNKTKGKLMN